MERGYDVVVLLDEDAVVLYVREGSESSIAIWGASSPSVFGAPTIRGEYAVCQRK